MCVMYVFKQSSCVFNGLFPPDAPYLLLSYQLPGLDGSPTEMCPARKGAGGKAAISVPGDRALLGLFPVGWAFYLLVRWETMKKEELDGTAVGADHKVSKSDGVSVCRGKSSRVKARVGRGERDIFQPLHSSSSFFGTYIVVSYHMP